MVSTKEEKMMKRKVPMILSKVFLKEVKSLTMVKYT